MASRGKNARLCGSVAAFSAIAAVSCSSPDKGSLVLAISTDMQAPQDISVVSIFVSNNGVPKFDYLGAVTPDGTVTLPATLALVESENPSDEIHIRVTAFQKQKARVMRDVLTHIPHQHTSLLRLPLNFLDDGSVVGTLDSQYVPGRQGTAPEGDTQFNPVDPTVLTSPTCDVSNGQTSFAGGCIDAHLDSDKLPAWTESAVYGDGGTATTPTCFDVTQCFAKAMPITNIDMNDCSFPLPQGANGSRWNCAIATTDGTGSCANGLCLVPLETDPNEGFTVQNGTTIKMVPGVCKKIAAHLATLYADNSAACAQKVEGAPVCQPAEAIDAGAPLGDGGTILMGDASDEASGQDATVSADGGIASEGGGTGDAATDGATVCQPPSGAAGGLGPGALCGDPDAGTDGGIPACGGSCGSHSCAAPPSTGTAVCQPSSGCHVSGESCTSDIDCCGASADGGGVTCMSINACGVGICGVATGCLPNGAFCRISGSASACNASTNCCSSTLSPSCKLDNMGVARCASLTCLPAGTACASSADCCAGVPCVPSAPDAGLGTLTCYSAACVPAGGACTANADCCSGATCTVGACTAAQ